MPWYLIETLTSTMSVVWGKGRRSDWGSVRSIDRTEGVGAVEIVKRVRRTNEPFIDVVKGRGPRRVIGLPIVRPDGQVSGVNLWVGDPDETPTPPRVAAAVTWRMDTMQVHQTGDCHSMTSVDSDSSNGFREPHAFLRKVFLFDQLSELLELATEPDLRPHFLGTLQVLHDDGHLMNWQAAARVGNNTVEALCHDISDTEPPGPNEMVAARLISKFPTAEATALIAFPQDPTAPPTIAYWVSQPPTWLAAATPEVQPPPSIIHCEDYPALRTTRQLLAGADATATLSCPVRLRNNADGWTNTTISLTKYPGAANAGRNLLLGRVSS